MREKILTFIEKNSRIDLKMLKVKYLCGACNKADTEIESISLLV